MMMMMLMTMMMTMMMLFILEHDPKVKYNLPTSQKQIGYLEEVHTKQPTKKMNMYIIIITIIITIIINIIINIININTPCQNDDQQLQYHFHLLSLYCLLIVQEL